MIMIDALKAFDAAAHHGTGSQEYATAIANFAQVQVETLEDVSTIIAIAVEVVRAGHIDTGLTMIVRGQQVLDGRLRKIRPAPR